ncbi:MAG: NAD(P)/FAD-dependent oxidoreductase [Desulfosarcina sp.]|jgi:glutathione reductase (NADPH)
MVKAYDALVIGSGTAGQTAAYELNHNGLKVGLVEHSSQPGGTCALSGCQAKKWFYEGTETVARSRHLTGAGITSPAFASWSQLRDAKNRFTDQVPSNTVNGLRQAGVDFIVGRARFVDRCSVDVEGQRISADFIVLATGAVPMKLPIDGAELMITSSEFLELDRLPSRVVFIGGGFISFEFAHFVARLGPTDAKCTIVEADSCPLGPFDEEMVALLLDASSEVGIDIYTEMEITGIEKNGRAFIVHTQNGRQFVADLVVHGAGRVANIDDLALDRAGIETSRHGVNVNEKMETTNSAVYAVGDCAATVQLARVADAEAQSAASNIVSAHKGVANEIFMNYTAVPAILFTYPQYGMVGATEKALQEGGIAYEKRFTKNLSWPTYKRVGMKSAAYKLLVSKQNGCVLGAHIISDNATGLINTFTLAMHNRIPVKELHRQCVMTPYPSRESDVIYMLKPLL